MVETDSRRPLSNDDVSEMCRNGDSPGISQTDGSVGKIKGEDLGKIEV